MAMDRISAEYARSLLDYDPETGVLTWKFRLVENFRPTKHRTREHACNAWNAKNAGNQAGAMSHGYMRISILKKAYPAHRVAWLVMTGEWPRADVDHANMDRSDNRWTNLREASRSQNKANQRMRSTNTSGWTGVIWDKERGNWRAQIKVGYRNHCIGRFDCPAAASFAYQVAADKAFGEFARAS